ncbi:MAG: DUF1428 domain-containing protein [Gammaproteobacteria bacterium]|nr:DUF1428 domain-containing protein [Gammaproteobacteria bacterium]
MSYTSVWVVAVTTANKEKYIAQVKEMAQAFKDNGALEVVDCWGAEVPEGKITSFPLAVQKKEDETVALGYMHWPNKETHDKGMPAAMSDPRLSHDKFNNIFDGSRMIFADFEVINKV